MANLSLTTECNRHCRYCFARPVFRSQVTNAKHMPPEIFERALDFLKRSNIDQVRLLGGEPTLHPQFPQFVEKVKEHGLRLLVFSNGFIPEQALRCLEKTPVEQTTILINVAIPDPSHPVRHKRQTGVFRRLGPGRR